MASNPSDALILWDPHSNGALVKFDRDPRRDAGGWALFLDALRNPSPGRTLDHVYSSLGGILEKRANRAAHALGLGPAAVAEKIKAYFGDGDERVRQLELLRSSVPSKLEKRCLKLMKYSMPTESPNTQCRAFKDIVHLVTIFPGLRAHFLHGKCSDGTASTEALSETWHRSTGSLDEEWLFWKILAATCLCVTPISKMLEESTVPFWATCEGGRLSVIEQLLIEHESSGASQYSRALCIRYLGGILDLPGFWSKIGNVHSNVAKKLCSEMVRVLKDIGVDILELGFIGESEKPFDYEGVDFLATCILDGLSSWFGKIDRADWTLQPWYENFIGFLQLLRWPRAAELLPTSSACASETFAHILPIVFQAAELNMIVDRDNEMEDNHWTANNDSLVDFHTRNISVRSVCSKISDHNDTHNRAPLPEDDGDAQSQDSDMNSPQQPSQNEADNPLTSDDESCDSIGHSGHAPNAQTSGPGPDTCPHSDLGHASVNVESSYVRCPPTFHQIVAGQHLLGCVVDPCYFCTQCRGYKSPNTDEPRRVHFSADSMRLFVGTDEEAAWVLDTATGESSAISTAGLPSGMSFQYAHFTRDGQRVYWGSREGPVFLKTATGELLRLEGVGYGQHSRPVAISHDERLVLVANETNSAALCDSWTGETLMTFMGHHERVCRAAFASVLP